MNNVTLTLWSAANSLPRMELMECVIGIERKAILVIDKLTG